ncbi:hypothetical protein THRCLA_21907, partial [Thraustotheca clavata]
VYAEDNILCYVLTMEDYKRSVLFTLTKPLRTDPRLQIQTESRGMSRSDISHMKARAEASAHTFAAPMLASSNPFWKATWSEHMNDSQVDEGSGTLKKVDAESWRQKKRNGALLQAKLEHINKSDAIEFALVLYVLSGPNRGDVQIVNNCAVIGNKVGHANIQLNERGVSNEHAWIYHRNG